MIGKCLLGLALALYVTQVSCITNQEFAELIRKYGKDVEETDISTMEPDEDDDVTIVMPGGPDHEIELEDILQFIPDLENQLAAAVSGNENGVGWPWSHHHHHHHHYHNPCSCHHFMCKCCIHHRFSFNLIFKHFHVNFDPCVVVAVIPNHIGVELTVMFNGRTMYHHEVSLVHPPALCYGVPGLRGFAKVCIEIYNVNLATKSLCVRAVGKIDIKIHSWSVHLNIACFRIPLASELELNKHLLNADNWELVDEVTHSDHADDFIALQESE